MVNFKQSTALALLVAAGGIVAQMAAGVADYAAVPPGLVILLAAAAIVWILPWRWVPLVGILASAFMIVGLFAAGQASRLTDVVKPLDTFGLWLQMVAVVVALVAGILALVRPSPRTERA